MTPPNKMQHSSSSWLLYFSLVSLLFCFWSFVSCRVLVVVSKGRCS